MSISATNLPPTVAQLVTAALQRLQALADPQVATQAAKFFKAHETVHFFGVKAPVVRQLERELFQQVKGRWTLAEASGFCDALLGDQRQEAKTIGILLLARFEKAYDRELFAIFGQWLAQDYCANWALTDALGTFAMPGLLRRFPDLLPSLLEWTQAENLWVRRASAVALVPLARKGVYLDEAYMIVEKLAACPEDLMHKAIGWLLREAGKADAQRLKAFLLAQGVSLPRTSVRYAIERFTEAERRVLLLQTRSA